MNQIISLIFLLVAAVGAHDAKDFDDSVLYQIAFEVPDVLATLKFGAQLRTFYTQEKEKYECLIPALEIPKEAEKNNEAELSPIGLIQPIFSSPTCSFRIEAYWAYEVCHGHHVRQYHEEREGKNVKFQEYYLGKWSEEKTELAKMEWEAQRQAGIKPKYNTLKIDNSRYPYFEMEFTDGTMCDLIGAPRTTMVRYVCYPHGKDDIYSFKETSSCNYEAIVLTSALCSIPAFHAEETKEISIKCFNSPTEPNKPISMLRQELHMWEDGEADLFDPKDNKAKLFSKSVDMVKLKHSGDLEKIILQLMANGDIEVDKDFVNHIVSQGAPGSTPLDSIPDMTPIKEFISGKNCLTGGTGWWKFEFCYGRHVRQFHKDKSSEVELFLGYFSEESHRQWASSNPDKGARRPGFTSSIWHHYEKGTHCDRSGLPREVDVKLTCTTVTNSGTAVSMYLLEPKTCQYILVVESPIICDLMQYADNNGLITPESLQKFLTTDKPAVSVPSSAQATESEEQIRS